MKDEACRLAVSCETCVGEGCYWTDSSQFPCRGGNSDFDFVAFKDCSQAKKYGVDLGKVVQSEVEERVRADAMLKQMIEKEMKSDNFEIIVIVSVLVVVTLAVIIIIGYMCGAKKLRGLKFTWVRNSRHSSHGRLDEEQSLAQMEMRTGAMGPAVDYSTEPSLIHF